MQNTVQTIPLVNLAIAFLPVMAVLLLFTRWQLNLYKAVYALTRMLGQLLLIGYGLNYVFVADSAYIILLVLAMMVLCSSWISLGIVSHTRRLQLYKNALLSIAKYPRKQGNILCNFVFYWVILYTQTKQALSKHK